MRIRSSMKTHVPLTRVSPCHGEALTSRLPVAAHTMCFTRSLSSCAVTAFKSCNVVTPILTSTLEQLNPRSFVPVVRASHHFACVPESRHFYPLIVGDAAGTADITTPVDFRVGPREKRAKGKGMLEYRRQGRFHTIVYG